MINGKEYDMEDVQLRLLGRRVFGCTAITYGNTQEKIKHYGTSKVPVSYSREGYEASGEITLLQSEFEAIQKALPRGKSLTDIAPFDITVTYAMEADPDPVTDVLKGCQFNSVEKSLTAGEGGMEVTLPLHVMFIEYNK
jgi:hypothetical protein